MTDTTRAFFLEQAANFDLVPVTRRILSDFLTPVLAYRRLVSADQRTDTSFLLESVETGGRVGRYSILAAGPSMELTARGGSVHCIEHASGKELVRTDADPIALMRDMTSNLRIAPEPPGQRPFCGGWAGWQGYDCVRRLEPEALPIEGAPPEDRDLPDLHMARYDSAVVFDHVDKTIELTVWVATSSGDAPALWDKAQQSIDALLATLRSDSVALRPGHVAIDTAAHAGLPGTPVIAQEAFESVVQRCVEYIRAGDVFQVVPSQRFDRTSQVDPFAVYRALRVVNPSPYMIYMQSPDVMLMASSPEILCRVRGNEVVSRPLAGTRQRGMNAIQDAALETELLEDQKERSEHAMLVDLARNDLGTVCAPGTVTVDRLMDVERYSHVMHLSSTVTGTLRPGMDCWDALAHTLPVGTVSGAPKIRAMQIIDECETVRRGPYAGGIGYVSYHGDMDMAIALRTIVTPVRAGSAPWTYHLQAGAGVVIDSDPHREYLETVNKAAALGRALDLAESMCSPSQD